MALKYDLVIFDLDGTITDSGAGILNSAKHALKTLGYSIPNDDVMLTMIGPPLSVSLGGILGVDKKHHAEAGVIYREYFATKGYKDYSLYKGFRGLLTKLKHNGIKISLATSKPIGPTMRVMEYLRLSHFFDSINGIKDDDNEETKTTIIARALELEHTNAVMVGDRKYDGNGAMANNIDFIGAGYGFGDDDELNKAGAKAIAHSTEELASLLGLDNLPSPKGKFISIEGMDGCGKTTQVDLLYKQLNKFGFNFVSTREPGGCKISEEIRNILLSTDNLEMHKNTEALLYAAARSQHVQQLIKPSLNNGLHVMCDRFIDSSIAYQGGGRELGVDVVASINSFAVDGTMPDKTIYLKMDHGKAMERRTCEREPDRLEIEKSDFYIKTQNVFDNLANKNGDRFVVVNADDTIQNVANNVFENVAKALEPQADWEGVN